MFVASITILTLLTFNLIEKEPDKVKVFTSAKLSKLLLMKSLNIFYGTF